MQKTNSFFSKPGVRWTFGIFLVLLIIARIIAPSIILKQLNSHLAEVSPLYQITIKDLDLHFIRMAYSFDDVNGILKKDKSQFMAISKVDVSVAWRELLRLKVLVDVELKNIDLKITTETINALSGYSVDQAKNEAQDVKDATIPFKLESLRAVNSKFEFSDVAGLPPDQNFYLSEIEVVANNLTPRRETGISMFTAMGAIQGHSKIKAVGQIKTKATPAEWSINLELKDMELKEFNPIARRTVPITFKSGLLSLYVAAQSEKGKTKGYVKPFLKDLVLIGDRGDFKNFPQFIFEIAGTIGNFFLKNRETKTLATKVVFRTGADGKVTTDTGKALSTAIDNGMSEPLTQSIDETLELKE